MKEENSVKGKKEGLYSSATKGPKARSCGGWHLLGEAMGP